MMILYRILFYTAGAILLPATTAIAFSTLDRSSETPQTITARVQSADAVETPALTDEPASPAAETTPSPIQSSVVPVAAAESTPLEDRAATTPSAIPYREDDAVERTLGRLGWVLLLLAALWGAVLYLRTRRQGMGGSRFDRRLRVVETLRLSSRNALYLIEMDHRTLLLGMNGTEMKVLSAPPHLPVAHLPMLAPDEDGR